jgi:hypothetical protein
LSDLINTGFALGPLRVAAIGAGEGLRWALLAGTGLAFLALICFWRASHSIGREFAANAD